MEKITTFIAYWLAVALAYLGAMSPEKDGALRGRRMRHFYRADELLV